MDASRSAAIISDGFPLQSQRGPVPGSSAITKSAVLAQMDSRMMQRRVRTGLWLGVLAVGVAGSGFLGWYFLLRTAPVTDSSEKPGNDSGATRRIHRLSW